jgi:serine phosphatase RsbU (regulator of sigma subunit)
MFVVFAIGIVLRLANPTDGTRLVPGFANAWQPDGIVIAPIDEDRGDANNFRLGDKLTAVDGVSMTVIADGLFKGGSVPPLAFNQPRLYTFVRDGRQLNVSVQPEHYPLSTLIAQSWGAVLVTLFTLLLATFLFVQRPNQQLVRALLLMGMAGWGITAYGIGVQPSDLFEPPRFWLWLILIVSGILLYNIGLLRFSLSFAPPPTRLFQTMNRPRTAFLTFFLPCLAASIYLAISYFIVGSTLQWLSLWIPFIASLIAVIVVLSAVFIVLSYRGNPDEVTRKKIRLIVFGGLASAAAFVLMNVVPIMALGRPLLNANVLSLGALPFTVAAAIAIYRYRLIDIDFVINRTLVYVFVTVTLLLICAAILFVLLAILGSIIHSAVLAPVAIFLTVSVVILLFNPLRDRVQLAVDRRFYRSRFVARQLFTQFALTAQNQIDADQLKSDLIAVITDAMQPSHASVWERSDKTDDPLLAALAGHAGAMELDNLQMPSPLLDRMRADGDKLAVPLMSQGALVGFIRLGARKNGQEYSRDDRRLLDMLATQVASPLHTAQLACAQQAEAVERERIEQEMNVARRIQHALLPRDIPNLVGYTLQTFYQPARAVGGDFYDFIELPAGKLGIFIGDVSDKGVPAAMVMTAVRTVLRSQARLNDSPGATLMQANDILCPDMPANMFVTCFYAVLNPATGALCFANAGQDLPYLTRAGAVSELRARGMPLGLMPGMRYEENEAILQPGDLVLFYSDGLVEAHDPRREMFGFDRLCRVLETHCGVANMVDCLMQELHTFAGADWMQEDDITMVLVRRNLPAPIS